MYLPKPSEGGDFTPVPEGTHPATCYRFIDLGTQSGEWKGKPKHDRKIMLSWEITDPELMNDEGKPFVISSRYTWSMSEKANLRKLLEAWRGKKFEESDFGDGGFDTRKLLGAGCLLSVVHEKKDDKTYSNISGVLKLPKGMTAVPPINPLVYFSLEEFDREVFASLSDSLQATIKASPEYQAIGRPPESPADYVPPHFDGGDPGWQPDAAAADIPF